MLELFDMLGRLNDGLMAVVILVGLVAGVLQCFLGYKMFRAWTAVCGFLVGGFIGAGVGYLFMQEAGFILGFLLIGLLGGWLAFKLYQLSVFVLCFAGGALFSIVGMVLLDAGFQTWMLAIAVVIGLIVGIVGVILVRPIIILSTGINGGVILGSVLGMLFDNIFLSPLLGIICIVLGCIVQFKTTEKKSVPGYAGYASAANAQTMYSGYNTAYMTQTYAPVQTNPQDVPTVLVQNEHPLWTAGSPVFVTKACLTEQRGNYYLNLEFQNLANQTIIALDFSANCYNLMQQELRPIERQTIQYISLGAGSSWTSNHILPFLNPNTRRIDLVIHRVVMADRSVWNNETGAVMTPYIAQGC